MITETLKTAFKNISLEYFKRQNHVNIFWHNGNRWILACQSSGKHFIHDIEVLKKENNNVGAYKIFDSELMMFL